MPTRWVPPPFNKRHTGKHQTATDAQAQQPGLVISNYGAALAVESLRGKIYRCTTRRRTEPLVCGDRVIWQITTGSNGVILSREPRTTLLTRPDARGQPRPIAANVEQLVVVCAPAPNIADSTQTGADAPPAESLEIDTALIDAYLVGARLGGMQAVIVINKIDLLNAAGLGEAKGIANEYAPIGYEFVFASSLAGEGLDRLAELLRDKISVVVGQSGVGKSSLIKALLPDQDIRIGELSKASGKGRHTTTVTTLYHLPGGGDLIDSPGVREFAPGQIDARELAHGFPEFLPFLGTCRFRDCLHHSEPGCAVREACRNGQINERRMRSYLSLLNMQAQA